MDCAAKFEKKVAALPGVTRAILNATTGKLTIAGKVDLEAIRQEAKKENYVVMSDKGETDLPKGKVNWELIRVLISGVALGIGYGLDLSYGESTNVIGLFLVAMVVGGWGNFRKAFYSLPKLDFNMSVLMSVAILGAVSIGQWSEGAVVAFLYAISEMLEAWTMERARHSIGMLMDIAPKIAWVRRDSSDIEIPVEDIRIDDIMIVRPGEKLAMDGIINKGQSALNQAAITGESLPVDKTEGDEVFAGTLNTNGYLEVRVTKLVSDTTLSKIIHMVEEAQTKRAPSQAFVDRFAKIYTPVVIVLALGIVLVPPLLLAKAWGPWIYRGLALLVVACPCALVISTPVAIVSAISNAARNGVLIKGGLHLEQAGALQAIAFDKTGTLTKGEPVLTDIIAFGGISENELLMTAASVEMLSEHPLAQAIVKETLKRNLTYQPAKNFQAILGRGAQGETNSGTIFVGNVKLFAEGGASLSKATEMVNKLEAEGRTAIVTGNPTEVFGILAVADEVREDSKVAIAALHSIGIKQTIMLTGDNNSVAQVISAKVGVKTYQAELLPQDKVKAVEELKNKYGNVGMVGDGINDAPALATATVGIAMGGAGTDTALETADIALMADDLTKLPFTIKLSRKALNIIRQNITFALAIKIIAVLAVFPGWLTLWLAILADMGATIIVTLNSIRLLRVKP